jgi:hypothetical protein
VELACSDATTVTRIDCGASPTCGASVSTRVACFCNCEKLKLVYFST